MLDTDSTKVRKAFAKRKKGLDFSRAKVYNIENN